MAAAARPSRSVHAVRNGLSVSEPDGPPQGGPESGQCPRRGGGDRIALGARAPRPQRSLSLLAIPVPDRWGSNHNQPMHTSYPEAQGRSEPSGRVTPPCEVYFRLKGFLLQASALQL